ncbi:RuBisCO chaperone RbcX [Pseudanabaena sp. PCC 6802]|uniref:RuBisCO chaperone RbcX n=1 Tax=Pseudanabaena sp. PCC 6802 TaxID=118173 RepID=UPI000346506F|nr:chaperonin family protein RbcX [Pseudanabaena sp. PCC 6802]
MDLKRIAKATAKTLSSYLTYEAMRTVVDQLQETNPPLAHWLAGFSPTGKLQDGEIYLEALLQANQELAFRIMTVRQHLAEEIADFLPEMTRSGIQESNMRLRCQHLERIVNFSATTPDPSESANRSIEHNIDRATEPVDPETVDTSIDSDSQVSGGDR